ncbi:hypothetical protein [Paenibacillus taichungensis]|uniref:hypothetical protein n=1 Tax=Paenibacillus taichungensis TaxID=484184 RepID=UPI0038D134E6
MDVCLPFNDSPVIDTYSYHANIVSIISNYNELKPWIYQRFLRLTYCKDDSYLDFCDGDYFDYYKCKVLYADGKRYLAEFRNNNFFNETDVTEDIALGDVTAFLIQCLNNNSYIFIHLDHYFIKGSDPYKKFHRNHESVVYGYNMDERVFYVSDNFVVGKYVGLQISFTDLELARKSSEDYELKRVLQVSIRKGSSVSIDVKGIHNKLSDYLSSRDSSCYGIITKTNDNQYYHNEFKYDWHWYSRSNKDEKFVYGINIHRFLKEDLRKNCSDKSALDLRRYQALLNHKIVIRELVVLLLEYSLLCDGEDVIHAIKQSVKQTLIIRNYAIKYNLTRDTRILDKIMNFHENSMLSEKKLFRNILTNLKVN